MPSLGTRIVWRLENFALIVKSVDWASTPMGQEIVYCSICGDRILESDFKKGKAVTFLKRNYCAKCAKESLEVSKKSQAPPSAQAPPAAASVRKLETRRIPLADNRVPRSPWPVPLPYLIAIGVGLLAILLLLVVLARK